MNGNQFRIENYLTFPRSFSKRQYIIAVLFYNGYLGSNYAL